MVNMADRKEEMALIKKRHNQYMDSHGTRGKRALPWLMPGIYFKRRFLYSEEEKEILRMIKDNKGTYFGGDFQEHWCPEETWFNVAYVSITSATLEQLITEKEYQQEKKELIDRAKAKNVLWDESRKVFYT